MLYLERWPDEGFWRLPITVDKTRTLGTFLHLYDDGKIESVTVRPGEFEDQINLIKPEDK